MKWFLYNDPTCLFSKRKRIFIKGMNANFIGRYYALIQIIRVLNYEPYTTCISLFFARYLPDVIFITMHKSTTSVSKWKINQITPGKMLKVEYCLNMLNIIVFFLWYIKTLIDPHIPCQVYIDMPSHHARSQGDAKCFNCHY